MLLFVKTFSPIGNFLRVLAPALLVLVLLGCSAGNGLPSASGQYEIKPNSLTYDGRDYQFFWKDQGGVLHEASGQRFKMVEDSRTFLEIGSGDPIIHLAKEEPVIVRGRDSDGAFTTSWFPFFLGYTMGGGFGSGPVIINQPYPGSPTYSSGTPTYHYPPADSFGRDESLHGSITNSSPSPPDYSRVNPAPYAVSGQNGGTGGGNAASNKGSTTSGQSGGTGAGSAASNKGGFAAGSRTGASSSSGVSGGGASSKTTGGGVSSGATGGRSGGGIKSSGGGRRR